MEGRASLAPLPLLENRMAAPRHTIAQMPYRNPHATAPLILTVIVVANTPDEELADNIRINSAMELPWLRMEKAHDRTAIMVGGGPSAEDHIEDIRALQQEGGVVFAMNAASSWLRTFGIVPNYQVIADAQPGTASLVDPWARAHLFASQVNPATMKAVAMPTVWHLALENIEDLFPAERKRRGGYALTGGGTTVGNTALCVAYAMGHRKFDLYGYDSSHKGEASHAYDQPMNQFIPTADVEWAGKTYHCSVAMKAQAEKFQVTARDLLEAGCELRVHGDGLLPAMWNTPVECLSEQDKYRLLWQLDSYRHGSPGEDTADLFLDLVKPAGRIVDFGCGTGRAALKMAARGHDVLLVDFADNCRDEEATGLPFLECDLTEPVGFTAPYGFCADVMEHIPPSDVDTVIRNIMDAAAKVFFQISTVPDRFGAVIHQSLHLTVKDHDWWQGTFRRLGFKVEWANHDAISCRMLISKETP